MAVDGSPRTIRIPGRTTAVEICDLLTPERTLVRVKRHFSSSNLSHLFAQGAVSAELLQMNSEFRQRAHERVVEFADGIAGFDFFDTETFINMRKPAGLPSWRGGQAETLKTHSPSSPRST
jgi:hypothetical protein